MDLVYEQKLTIGPSSCDADRLLSHHAAFNLLQDTAAIHAARLGIGLNALEKRSLYWVIVKIKTVFARRPGLGEKVVLRTWPEKPGTLRCNRSFELLADDEVLMRVHSEWAVLNAETRRPVPCAEIFPPELDYTLPPAHDEPFARIPGRFDGIEPFARYTVTSSDVDLLGHMNNAAYPRALFGCFTVAERREHDLRAVDLIFRSPCYEGETLDFRRLDHDGVLDVCASRGDDVVFLARLEPGRAME